MKRSMLISALGLLLGACGQGETKPAAAAAPAADAPPPEQVAQFTPDGKLIRPKGYEEWVMVGASTGLSYNAPQKNPVAGEAPGFFHNIFMQPWAFRETMKNGRFPEGTMFIMTFYNPSRKSRPAKNGFYEGDMLPGFEVHLKKAGVHESGWGFYGFGDDTTSTAAVLPASMPCYSCHKTETKFDNAFVQFYPPLRKRLLKPDSLAV